MLTRPVAAVKFDLSSTPEQAACAMKIDEGLRTFWNGRKSGVSSSFRGKSPFFPTTEIRCQLAEIRGGNPGRVDRGGCPPRPPTDPGLHITRTRFLIS